MNLPKLVIANLATDATSSTNSKATFHKTIEATVMLQLLERQEFAVNLPKLEIANLVIDATSSMNSEAMLHRTIEAIVM